MITNSFGEIMKTVIALAAICVGLNGCASPRNSTKAFYAQEGEVAKMCLAPVLDTPAAARFAVNPQTRRSPFSDAAWCYSNQIKSVVQMTHYQHAGLVSNYADYLVRLTAAHDQGILKTPTAVAAYQQTSALFRQSVETGDAQIEAQARRDLGEKLAIFTAAMSAVALEQDRQRALNRPVVCTLTGVYVQNTVVCN